MKTSEITTTDLAQFSKSKLAQEDTTMNQQTNQQRFQLPSGDYTRFTQTYGFECCECGNEARTGYANTQTGYEFCGRCFRRGPLRWDWPSA